MAAPKTAASGSGLSVADYQALGAFRLALRRFAAFSEARALEVGLTAQQHQALLAVRTHAGPEPMSIGELADSLLIKNHSAVGLVARLVDRGLVTRAPSDKDRRRVLLTLTPEAERLLAQVSVNNLRELSASAPVFRELLKTIRRIGQDGAGAAPAEARAPKTG